MLLVDPAHLSVSLGKNVLECDRGTNTLRWGVEHEGNIIVQQNLPIAINAMRLALTSPPRSISL